MTELLRWLLPGLRVKRWLVLFSAGLALASAGLAIALDWRVYVWLGGRVQDFIYRGTGRFFSPPVGGVLVLAVGISVMAVALERIARWLLEAIVPPGTAGLARLAVRRRILNRGPRVVAIGGGTGLPVVLRGLKEYTSNITALVTVADDGGSSGRLRGEFRIPPPGDIRNCLVALADTEGLMERLFMHRFEQGAGLAGHNFGNLFILALAAVTGDFEEAIRQSSQVLAIRGRVLPVTLRQVTLDADLADGRTVRGESEIGRSTAPIRRVRLVPPDPPPLEEALTAIDEADIIVLGPGSLFTSVIPNLLVPGIADRIRRSSALKVYVCNVMTQPGETAGFTHADHVRSLVEHAGPGLIDLCLVNTAAVPGPVARRYADMGSEPVRGFPLGPGVASQGIRTVGLPLLADGDVVRHDPERLARAIMAAFLDGRARRVRPPWEVYLWRRAVEAAERRDA